MLAGLKDKLLAGVNRLSGNTDFLEAVCASSALVAAADGHIDDEEVLAALDAVKTNAALSKAFKPRDIEKTMNTMLERTRTSPGRLGLLRELEQVSQDQGEIVFLAAYDVAKADGNIDKDETAMLDKIAGKLGVNGSDLMV